MAINDDWSYIFSAKVLADTGHVTYNGWATAMMGWQLYWAAVFIKLFGFSFTIMRVATLVVAMLNATLLYKVFVRFGLTERNATLCTLTVILSPLSLPLTFSFMSDIPGLFCLVGCMYLCLRALQASTDRAAVAWLVAAALSNVIGGTVRQITWLGVLVMVPSFAWCMRRRRFILPAAAVTYFVSVAAIFCCMHWFSTQNYAIVEKIIASDPQGRRLGKVIWFIRSIPQLSLLLLPIMVGFIARHPLSRRRLRTQAFAIATLIFSAAYFALRHSQTSWLAPFSGNYVTAKGILQEAFLLGQRPDVLSTPVRAVLTFAVFTAMAACALCLWRAGALPGILPAGSESRYPGLSDRAVFLLLGPLTTAYLLLTVTRQAIFDRYLLPYMVIFLILAVRFYQQKIAAELPAISWLTLLLFTVYSIASMHDLFAIYRARLEAADELRAMGVARQAFHAGFEYDAWTQLELSGHINDPRIRTPAGDYAPLEPPPGVPLECRVFFDDREPGIHATYILSFVPSPCSYPSALPPVHFSTWLAPRQHGISILRVP